MIAKEVELKFQSFDGLLLRGTFLGFQETMTGVVVLVHGGGVNRDEDGFYIRLANKLLEAGIASFRFDFRAHGTSEGKLEEMTLLEVVNDIHAAVDFTLDYVNTKKGHVVGTSFGGGLSAYFAAMYPDKVQSLVLMNPLLNYKRRLLEEKPFWRDGRLTDEGIRELKLIGWLPHGTALRMGRALINELFHIQPYIEMSRVLAPILTIHGTRDSMVPFDVAWKYHKANVECEFLRIEGADHGFTVPGDEDYSHPQTKAWQGLAIDGAVGWISRFNAHGD